MIVFDVLSWNSIIGNKGDKMHLFFVRQATQKHELFLHSHQQSRPPDLVGGLVLPL